MGGEYVGLEVSWHVCRGQVCPSEKMRAALATTINLKSRRLTFDEAGKYRIARVGQSESTVDTRWTQTASGQRWKAT